MKTPTLIDRYKKENTETKSQTEVDNGVHPLHQATSPGPSPMGTDPINGFKNGTNGSGINLSICRNKNAGQEVFKTSSLELTTWTSKDKEAKL